MPVPALFTTGDIGGAGAPHKTRFKGPLRIGTLTTAPTTLVDPHGSTGGTGGGTAASPLYSYALRPDMGLYLQGVTSSAPDMRVSRTGLDVWSWSSAQTGFVGSSQAAGVGLVAAAGLMGSSGGTVAGFYLPQTTYAMSSSTNANIASTPTLINSGAVMVFDSLRNKISVYSSVLGDWLSVTLTSS